ncbi:MAG TPA: hypothetical protein VGL05_00955, partial [Kribbella sp.]
MPNLWVHGLAALDDNAPERLAADHPDWRFTDGSPAADAAYDVLVAGRPSRDLLTASPRWRTSWPSASYSRRPVPSSRVRRGRPGGRVVAGG